MMTPKEVASQIVKTLDAKKAGDIRMLHTQDVTILADYFVICTANSPSHGKTLVEEAARLLSEAGEPPLRREGYRSGGWVLLDVGCVIIHVFSQELRDFYALERLWSDAEIIDPQTMLNN